MIRILQVGVGPLGQRCVRAAIKRGGLKIVAAVDPAEDKVGRDLGEVCGVGRLGVKIREGLSGVPKGAKPQAAVLTTVSDVQRIESQVAELARAGLDVVSTCEELAFPWESAPAVAGRIDQVCREHGVTCLGTGINPGFLMDFLPSVLTGLTHNVTKVVVRRVQDASKRRVPFQQKIGAALTPAEFAKKKKAGTLRHVGLTESMHAIARAVGWKLDKTTDTIKPVIADGKIGVGYKPIEAGMARGVAQTGRGYVGRKQVITLEFIAAVAEPESFDSVELTGEPSIKSVIQGGVNGDVGTCAVVLNCIPRVVAAGPGLKTMLDLPAPTVAGA